MKIGIAVEETWGFFDEVYQELSKHHNTTSFRSQTYKSPVFQDRINKYIYLEKLKHFLADNDVIFFEWASRLLVDATSLPKTCGIITRLHRYELYEWADKINWEKVDKVILVSKAKEKEFVNQYPQISNKTVVIPVGISLDRFNIEKQTYSGNIGTLARLQPRKRIYELILAFYELIQKNDGFHLHIGGGMRPRYFEYPIIIKDLVKRLNIQDKVTFFGDITKPEEWYANIDIFISNSYSEGLQVSPMEAMASGCYCLSHYWDGADELLPSENLYFTDRELNEKIIAYHVLPNSKKLKQCNDLRAMVHEKFDAEKIKVQIRELVEVIGNN